MCLKNKILFFLCPLILIDLRIQMIMPSVDKLLKNLYLICLDDRCGPEYILPIS